MKKNPLITAPSGKLLRLELLGGFAAQVDGVPLDIGNSKLRGLLVFLAMSSGIPLRREYLAELFWPDMPVGAARQNLRRTLSRLKSDLCVAGVVISAVRDEVMMASADLWLDVAVLTSKTLSCSEPLVPGDCDSCVAKMEQATSLYHGEFMAGFSLPDCPDFEDWLQTQRETLHHHALSLLEQLSTCHAQTGDYPHALQFALRYTELAPWDEEAHRRVIRLYALSDQHIAAGRHYETLCRELNTELGVSPDAATLQLIENIRNGKIERRSPDSINLPKRQTIPQAITERRQVTVLYCELTLATIADPEEATELLCTPQARCVELVRKHSGHIEQIHGGGFLAYFGYPQAIENAARLAVQAALGIIHNATGVVEVRACVHSGMVISGGASSTPDTLGRISKQTIDMRQSITRNEVAISQETRRMVIGYFDCVSLGVQPLAGFAQEIFRVVQESGARTRLEAATQLSHFVGRQTEMAELIELWQDVVQGARHITLLRGEAGMGKSRLLHTLKEHLTDQQHVIRELRCFPEFGQSPFYPLIAMFKTLYGFRSGDTAEANFDKLAKYQETHYPSSAHENVPLIAGLLSLDLSGNYQAAGLSSQQQKEKTILIVLEMLHRLASRQPVVLIVEDMQWIDPSTLELLTRFVEQSGAPPIFALFTTRPDFDPPWQESLNTSLAIAPLDRESATFLAASFSEDIPAATMQQIIERADGVPLFIEEMVKLAMLDSGAGIPATLHDLLSVRMDQMGDAKQTAQLAATIGREFNPDMLGKILAPATLTRTLKDLLDAGLILPVDDDTLQFKHALIQEAAYQSQPRADRQAAHKLIAQVLQRDFPEIIANKPELLASHLESGGSTAQAVEYWIKSGHHAVQHSAFAEARAHFSSALRLLMTLPAGQDRDSTEFDIRAILRTVSSTTQSYVS